MSRRIIYADGQDVHYQQGQTQYQHGQAAEGPPPIYPNLMYQRSDDPTVSSTNTDVMIVEDQNGRRMILSPAPSIHSEASVHEGMQIRYNNTPSPHVVSTPPLKRRKIPEQPTRKSNNCCWITIFSIIFLVCAGAFGVGIYFTQRETKSSSISTTVPPTPSLSPTPSPVAQPVQEEAQPTFAPTRPPTKSPTSVPTLASQPIDATTPTQVSSSTAPSSFSFSDDFVNTFLPSSLDEEFYLVELLAYRELADYNDGLPTSIPGDSSDNVYKSWLTKQVLPDIDGAEVLFRGEVKADEYDEVMIIKYPSGQAFIDYVLDSDDLANFLAYRMAGLDNKSRVVATQTMLDGIPEGLLQPPNSDDSPEESFLFLHTLHFRDDTGREAMAKFDDLSAPFKEEYGFRAAAWLEVKSAALFDSNEQVDEIRFEYVSSIAAWGKLLVEEEVPEIWKNRDAALDPEISVSAILSTDDDSTLFNLYN